MTRSPETPWRAALSAWTPLARKAVTYAIAFVALALVGSGAASLRLPGASPAVHVAGVGPAPPPPAPGAQTMGAVDPPSVASDAGAPEAVSSDGGAPTSDAGGVTSDGKVILNLATADDLRRLPGVGATRAQAILALRNKLGRFRRVEELLRVRGLGRRSVARLRPLVLVDPP